MKKLLRFLSSIILTVSTASQVFACSPPALGEVWIITDGGDIYDHAFNEQVLEGTQEFVTKFNSQRQRIAKIPGFKYWKNHQLKIKTIVSDNGEYSTLQNNYEVAGFAGAKTIVCDGFNHLSALTSKIQQTFKNLGVRFLLVDSRVMNPINVAALSYNSNQSGFLAGLAGAIWLMAHHEDYDANGLKMATYGGLPAYTVVNYMYGFYYGVYYFNKFKNTDPNILTMINTLRSHEKNKKPMNKEQLSKKNIQFDKSLKNSFTGDFNSGSTASQSLNDQLININKDAIVLPVAGAQTTDSIAAILKSSDNKKAKLVGVDVDQSVQYPSAKNLFITSALKNIKDSVSNALWNALDLNSFGDHSYRQKYYKHIFSTDSTPKGGQGYTGIADNQAINPIYGDITTNEDLSSLLPQVSAGWQKILAVGSNFWNNSEKASSNPFEFN